MVAAEGNFNGLIPADAASSTGRHHEIFEAGGANRGGIEFPDLKGPILLHSLILGFTGQTSFALNVTNPDAVDFEMGGGGTTTNADLFKALENLTIFPGWTFKLTTTGVGGLTRAGFAQFNFLYPLSYWVNEEI